MLLMPLIGIRRSVKEHNVDIDVLSDWIEATIHFDEKVVSKEEFVDILLEESICDEQDMAYRIVTDAWIELRRRQEILGKSSSFNVTRDRVVRKRAWQQVPAHSACLLMSFAIWNKVWAKQCKPNYNIQGELFEDIAKESIRLLFENWLVFKTGWSSKKKLSFTNMVNQISKILGETPGNSKRWTKGSEKDAELDILFYRSFNDGRAGLPVFLLQCASGENWKDKLHTPDLILWGKLIDFTMTPVRAFAIPFVIPSDDFHFHCSKVDGPMLDRYRLLGPGKDKVSWVSPELKKRIVNWAKPKVKLLPKYN